MDISAVSTIKAQAAVKGAVSVAITKNVMDIAKQNGENLTKMMEQSVSGSGANVDIKL